MEKIKDFHFYNLVLDKMDIDLPKPIYGRGYPRLTNYNGYTYKHMRNKADEIWGK